VLPVRGDRDWRSGASARVIGGPAGGAERGTICGSASGAEALKRRRQVTGAAEGCARRRCLRLCRLRARAGDGGAGPQRGGGGKGPG